MRPLVALTGGTGFLGRHVLTAFAAAGWRVRLLARRPDCAPRTVETVQGSLSDSDAISTLVRGADAVVHMAGLIRARSRGEFMAVNRDGTAALADSRAAHAPSARFVLVSSMAAREPGLSHYAASKAAGEAALSDTGAVILRPCAVYGPGDRATLPMFRAACWPAQPILNGPASRVGLIHVADVASAVVAAVRQEIPTGTWELTDARVQGYTWREIVAAACRACGTSARPVRVPAPVLTLAGLCGNLAALAGAAPMLTSGKAREILHPDWGSHGRSQPPATVWRPVRDIEDGFAQTATWYRAAGWLPGGTIGWARKRRRRNEAA